MNNRLADLLPWYVNGTLNADDRAWVEAELARNPAQAADALWLQSLQSRIRENEPAVAANVGLDRAMARIRTERARPARAARPTLGMRVSEWFAGFGLRPALGAAAAVIIVAQGAVLLSMYRANDDLTNQIRAARPATVAPRVEYLRITFKPDAREEEMRLAIAEVKGWLVDGPGSMGDYFIRVPGRTQDAEAALKQNPTVADVARVDRLPTRD
jgi:hypothetical protein